MSNLETKIKNKEQNITPDLALGCIASIIFAVSVYAAPGITQEDLLKMLPKNLNDINLTMPDTNYSMQEKIKDLQEGILKDSAVSLDGITVQDIQKIGKDVLGQGADNKPNQANQIDDILNSFTPGKK
ncbi:hypothetical protein ACHJH3_06515 [Campylobacter sp. MOP7]|uniref:hypothetical protein n=1 Tax=Campylobacter canis TaxID=3378588 RepID=UPI00387EA18B